MRFLTPYIVLKPHWGSAGALHPPATQSDTIKSWGWTFHISHLCNAFSLIPHGSDTVYWEVEWGLLIKKSSRHWVEAAVPWPQSWLTSSAALPPACPPGYSAELLKDKTMTWILPFSLALRFGTSLVWCQPESSWLMYTGFQAKVWLQSTETISSIFKLTSSVSSVKWRM